MYKFGQVVKAISHKDSWFVSGRKYMVLDFIEAAGDLSVIMLADDLSGPVGDPQRGPTKFFCSHVYVPEDKKVKLQGPDTVLISYTKARQAEGIARAKAEGRYRGRKPSVPVNKIRELAAGGAGATWIARKLGIARSSVYAALSTNLPYEDGIPSPILESIMPETSTPKKLTAKDSDNPKTAFGLMKPPIALIPMTALVEEACAFRLGAEKYGPANWREKAVPASVYINAAMRHMLSWYDGQDNDVESGASHLAHARACLAILIDAKSCDKLIDDRPPVGKGPDLCAERTLSKPT